MPNTELYYKIIKHLERLPADDSLHAYEQALLAAELEIAARLDPFRANPEEGARHMMMRNKPHEDITFHDPRLNGLAGLSGLPLYFVRAAGQMVAVVKAFPVGSLLFAKEVYALKNLQNLADCVPPIQGVGLCEWEGMQYFLLATTFIEAPLLNDAMLTMARMPHTNARTATHTSLLPTFFDLGSLLGKVHTLGATIMGNPPRWITDSQARALATTMLGLKDDDELGINPQDVAAYTHALAGKLSRHQIRYAYLHGDAHPGNYLFCPASERIIMLDCGNGALSFGVDNKPFGSPFIDYIKITASINVRTIMGLTEDECASFNDSLARGYSLAGGTLPHKELAQFYTLMEILDYFSWYFSHKHLLSADAHPMMRQILGKGAAWLSALLADEQI